MMSPMHLPTAPQHHQHHAQQPQFYQVSTIIQKSDDDSSIWSGLYGRISKRGEIESFDDLKIDKILISVVKK